MAVAAQYTQKALNSYYNLQKKKMSGNKEVVKSRRNNCQKQQ